MWSQLISQNTQKGEGKVSTKQCVINQLQTLGGQGEFQGLSQGLP